MVTDIMFQHLAGYVKCISEVWQYGKIKSFGWHSLPTISTVLEQMYIIKEAYMTGDQIGLRLQIDKIYNNIENYGLNFGYSNIGERFETGCLVFTEDGFYAPSSVYASIAESMSIDLTPYMSLLHRDFQKYKTLMVALGCREQLDANICSEVIWKICEAHKFKQSPDRVQKDRKLIIYLLDYMHNNTDLNTIDIKHIPVPIESDDDDVLLLAEAIHCTYRSTELKGTAYEDDFPFVHKMVSRSIAEAFGIHSLTGRIFSNRSLPFMDFGQKEELVTRIKNLLKEYPCDYTLFNEMLQNADDAGATEIHFVIDKRSHPTEGTFNDKWKELQGPALCVFNDACFSEADLKGIQRLGKGSKTLDPNKTGQFGVGFNVVYHITDVPCFISKGPDTPKGSTFCLFDPHSEYGPTANEGQIGCRVDNISILQSNNPNIYNTFLQGTNELQRDIGTWFRLPLRTDEMAANSRISQNSISTKDIEELMDAFMKNMKENLLFLKHLRKIELSIIDSSYQRMRRLCRVESTISVEDQALLKMFFRNCAVERKRLQVENMSLLYLENTLCAVTLTIECSNRKTETWIVVHSFGVDPNSTVDGSIIETLSAAIHNGNIGLLPCGAIALNKDRVNKKQNYVFCLLSLPKTTGLPVHVNGHFALNANRREIWADRTGVKSEYSCWNELLLANVIPRAYIQAIEMYKTHTIAQLGKKTKTDSIKHRAVYSQL